MKQGNIDLRTKDTSSFSDTSSENSVSFDIAIAEKYLTNLIVPQNSIRTPVKVKERFRKPRKRRFIRIKNTKLMIRDENSSINSDTTSTTSEDYEVVAQLVRRRPKTKISSLSSDSETSCETTDDYTRVVLFVPGYTRRYTRAEPPRKLCVDGLVDMLMDLTDSSF